MAKKKGITINSMIKDSNAQEWGYMLDGKKVSEFKFFNQIKKELRGDKAKKAAFYWTDEKVMICFKALGYGITKKDLADIKKQLSA